METFVAIVMSILSIWCFIMICAVIIFGALYHKSLFIQKLYTIMFERDDYRSYKEVKEYLKNNKMQLVSSIELSTAQVYKDDLIDRWIFAVFENNDVAIYDNSYTLRLTDFHNKLIQDLLNDAGYTQDDIHRVAEEGRIRLQQLERELEENYKELKALEEQLNKEKENND
jgi:hypothetical protein